MKKKLLLVLVCSLVLGLCACGNNANNSNAGSNSQGGQVEQNGSTNETTKQEPKEVVIELTEENLFEYYEIKPNIVIHRNDFDEITTAYLDMWLLCLKEEYVEKFVEHDFAYEFYKGKVDTSTNEYVYYKHEYICTYNIETEEFSYEVDKVKTKETRVPIGINIKTSKKNIIDDTKVMISKEDTVINYVLDVEGNIVRWQQKQQRDWNIDGFRVQGTLTILE